jgi:hypothetical protein
MVQIRKAYLDRQRDRSIIYHVRNEPKWPHRRRPDSEQGPEWGYFSLCQPAASMKEEQALADDLDQRDTFIKLASFRMDMRKERRQLEWRLTVAFWAVLVGVVFIYRSLCFPWSQLWSFAAVVLFHFLWVGLNWVRNERDIRKAFFYIDNLHHGATGEWPVNEPRFFRTILGKQTEPGAWPQVRGRHMLGFLFDGMFWAEIVVTIGLAWLAFFVVGQQHCARTEKVVATMARTALRPGVRCEVNPPITRMTHLRRAAIHEAGHAVAALFHTLPLLEVTVRADGSGITRYGRRLTVGEIEHWMVSVYSGPATEANRYGSAPVDGDEQTAVLALADLGLDWSDGRLALFRERARDLVRRERLSIRAVANELVHCRSLSGDQIAALVPTATASTFWVT